MADMTIKEIEEFLDRLSENVLSGDCTAATNKLYFIARQLLNAQKWMEIDDEAKGGQRVLITDGNWSYPAIWSPEGDAQYPWWILDQDGEDNRIKESSVIGWLPLPSPPQDKENGDV